MALAIQAGDFRRINLVMEYHIIQPARFRNRTQAPGITATTNKQKTDITSAIERCTRTQRLELAQIVARIEQEEVFASSVLDMASICFLNPTRLLFTTIVVNRR